MTTHTYASANDQWACHACPLVSSAITKPRQFSSDQLLFAPYMPLHVTSSWSGIRSTERPPKSA